MALDDAQLDRVIVGPVVDEVPGAVGYFAFAELPSVWTALGALVIVGSAFYIARREARLQRRAAAR